MNIYIQWLLWYPPFPKASHAFYLSHPSQYICCRKQSMNIQSYFLICLQSNTCEAMINLFHTCDYYNMGKKKQIKFYTMLGYDMKLKSLEMFIYYKQNGWKTKRISHVCYLVWVMSEGYNCEVWKYTLSFWRTLAQYSLNSSKDKNTWKFGQIRT